MARSAGSGTLTTTATTDFLEWNPTTANQDTDAEFLADTQRLSGGTTGSIAKSKTLNKLFRQSSVFCAAFGQMLANKGYTTSDSSVSTLAGILANVLTSADVLPAISTVTYSPTPVFSAALANGFQMTLSGNVTSSTILGVTPGQLLAFYFVQDSAGSRTVSFPSSFIGAIQPDPTANSISVMLFRADASGVVRAAGPVVSNNGIFLGSPLNGTSAAFSGAITTPTVATTDNSTNVPTTAWAKLGMAVSLGVNGYIGVPSWLGGWMIQWGTTSTLPDSSVSTQSFNGSGFQTQCFGVIAVDSSRYATGNPRTISVGGQTTSTFKIYANGSGATAFWFAIGN